MKDKPTATLGAIINEPLPGWIPIDLAVYYCNKRGFNPSANGWSAEVVDLIHLLLERPLAQELPSGPPPEWRVYDKGPIEGVCIETQAGSNRPATICSQILPGRISLTASDWCTADEGDWLLDYCGSAELEFSSQTWDCKVTTADRHSAEWHRLLLSSLCNWWFAHWRLAAREGSAQIIARKGNVFSPFEVIAWDQWQFFSLDEVKRPDTSPGKRLCEYPFIKPAPLTATGPGGARLFSIHAVPSDAANQTEPTPEMQCFHWLVELLQEYTNRSPRPLRDLADQAIAKFDGLSKNGFRRSLFFAQQQTQNRNWSNPGAPKRIPIPNLLDVN